MRQSETGYPDSKCSGNYRSDVKMVVITTPLLTASGVNDIYIAQNFALIATTSGVDVVDLLQGHVISSGILPAEPKCITADATNAGGKIYIGTAGSGIFSMSWVIVREPHSDFTGSLTQRFTTLSTPSISSNNVNDLDVFFDKLLIGTSAGIDFIVNETESATRTMTGGSDNVHLTTTGGGYWTTNSGAQEGAIEVNYDLITATGTGIIIVDFEYSTSSTPSIPAAPPVDIAISESINNPTILGFATPSGSIVVEENPGNESISNNKLLLSESTNSVDFSSNSSFSEGCLYTTTANVLRVIELSGNTVSGTHDVSEGTRDQTLITGTLSIVRTTDVGKCL